MTLYDLKKGSEISSIDLPLSLALGTFDGLHLGHAELIRTAKANGDKAGVFTFSKNPFDVPYLITMKEKLELLSEMGVDYCAFCDFEEIKEMPWQSFIYDILIKKLNVKTAVCGFNFKFGKEALGTAQKLKEEMEKVGRNVVILPPFELLGDTVSSSRIRALLNKGEIEQAATLLGRSYSIVYKVSRGNGIGSILGYPTINMPPASNSLPLARGVYISRCMGRAALTNFGVRPTVTEDSNPVYETFILDYNNDLYEKEVKVEFLKMLRPEYKFNSKEELTEQIAKDVEAAKEYFAKDR